MAHLDPFTLSKGTSVAQSGIGYSGAVGWGVAFMISYVTTSSKTNTNTDFTFEKRFNGYKHSGGPTSVLTSFSSTSCMHEFQASTMELKLAD